MGQQVRDDQVLLNGVGMNFAEAAMLCDGLKALWLSPEFIDRLWAELRKVIERDHLDEKWGADSGTLVERLSKLGCAESTAMVRAALRFWETREKPTAKTLRDLGLVGGRMLKTKEPPMTLPKERRRQRGNESRTSRPASV
jgi:hypothetical protein